MMKSPSLRDQSTIALQLDLSITEFQRISIMVRHLCFFPVAPFYRAAGGETR
jgi:hypothetical protein